MAGDNLDRFEYIVVLMMENRSFDNVLGYLYVEPGTVVGTPLDHTAIIRTSGEKWNLGHLTERDRAARTLAEVFSRTVPRPREAWPVTAPARCRRRRRARPASSTP